MAEAPTVQQDLAALKQELVVGAAQVASIGLVPLTQGNLSIRDVAKRSYPDDAARLSI